MNNTTVLRCKNTNCFVVVTVETNEQDIIQRFVRTDKTLVTWDHLSTVFRLWAIGLGTAGIIFICECSLHYLKKH